MASTAPASHTVTAVPHQRRCATLFQPQGRGEIPLRTRQGPLRAPSTRIQGIHPRLPSTRDNVADTGNTTRILGDAIIAPVAKIAGPFSRAPPTGVAP